MRTKRILITITLALAASTWLTGCQSRLTWVEMDRKGSTAEEWRRWRATAPPPPPDYIIKVRRSNYSKYVR